MARILTCLLLLGVLDGCAPGRSPLAGDAPPALPPAPYCTRSLADVDCWRDPRRLADRPPQVADGGWQAPALGRFGPSASAPPSGQRRGAVVPADRGRTPPAGRARSPAAVPPHGPPLGPSLGPPQRRPMDGAGSAVPPGGD